MTLTVEEGDAAAAAVTVFVTMDTDAMMEMEMEGGCRPGCWGRGANLGDIYVASADVIPFEESHSGGVMVV